MAFTESGIFLATWNDILLNNVAVDLEADTFKGALFRDTVTPNFNTDTAYGSAPWNSGEASGTGYVAGGATLAGKDVSVSGGYLMFDATDLSWASSSITAAGLHVYSSTVSNRSVVALAFGDELTTVAGTFAVVFGANGLFRLKATAA